MAIMDNDTLIASYSELLANFGTMYAATQESMKAQATTMAAMQGQLTNIQQFCMAVGWTSDVTSSLYVKRYKRITLRWGYGCNNVGHPGLHHTGSSMSCSARASGGVSSSKLPVDEATPVLSPPTAGVVSSFFLTATDDNKDATKSSSFRQ
jgi:hypothetical protein